MFFGTPGGETDLPPLATEGRPPQESYQELIASKCV